MDINDITPAMAHVLCDAVHRLWSDVDCDGETPWDIYAHTFYGPNGPTVYKETLEAAYDFVHSLRMFGDDDRTIGEAEEAPATEDVNKAYIATAELPDGIVDFFSGLGAFSEVGKVDIHNGTVELAFHAADEWELRELVENAVAEVEARSDTYVSIPRPTPRSE